MKGCLGRCPEPRRVVERVLALLFVLAVGLELPAMAAAPTVLELVNQFSATNYFNLVSNKLYTRAGMNRVPVELGGAQHDLCRDAIHAEFNRVGLNSTLDPFSYVDTTNNTLVNVCNIIAVKPGVQNPNNEIWVVGSHYDSKANPGADDNATGVACQLEMARIFAPHHFSKTIIFAIYDSEERWEAVTGRHRLGSLRHAQQLLTNNVAGMLNVDMIGWNAPSPNNNRAFICGRTAFDAIRQDFRNAMLTYGSGLTPVITNLDNVGDHYSFEQAGMSACMLLEAYYTGNPNYHKSTDYIEQPGYLDWDYLRKMCQSAMGFLAEKIQPVDVTPQILSIAATNGGVRINFTGLPRCQYATEICTNLTSPGWLALETNTASVTDGSFSTLDAQAVRRAGAFYRARFVAGYIGNPGPPPTISGQPLSRVADAGDAVSLSVTAAGTAPLIYQWYRNNAAIVGGTGSAYSLLSAQTNQAGSYLVVVTNDAGSVTSRVATLTIHPPQTVVFTDNFDANTAANWTVNKSSTDTRVTFNYDYAADGIPPAPHAVGGTTRGVKFEANMVNGVTAALSVSPTGQSFSGDYRLHFDMWINANGPFPLGGTGSSQFITGGLGTAGNRVQWIGSGSTADGCWFAVDGEGQAGDTSTSSDFNAYVATALQGVASGVYAAGTDANARGNGNAYYATAFPGGQTAPAWQQTTYPQQTGALAAGAVGFAWRDVIISKRGSVIEWSIDGVKLAAVTNATLTASNVFVGYWDPFTSLSDNDALSFGVVDNVRVEVPAP